MATVSSFPVYPILRASDADKVKVRTKLDENQTSSLEDPSFDADRGKKLNPMRIKQLSSSAYRLSQSQDAIDQHFDKRISHLFLQATMCYKTGLVFDEGHTIHQGLGAHAIEQDSLKIKFEAAHSATLPNLYAAAPGSTQKFVYLYRSGYYDEGNATIDVIDKINKADSAIDWQGQLRAKTIALLNRASKGELTPDEVAKHFIQELIVEVKKATQKQSDQEIKNILDIYAKKAQEMVHYVAHPDNIDRWLNLQLDDPLLVKVSEIVDKIEQDEPVQREEILALIKRKIHEIPPAIYQERHQKYNEDRVPVHFLDLFHVSLLNLFQGDELKEVEAALGINYADLKARASRFCKIGSTQALLNQHQQKIAQLAHELFPFIAKLQKKAPQQPLVGLSAQKKVALRPGVYRLRYEMIRTDQEAQSRIKSKIESIFNELKQGQDFSSFFHAELLASDGMTPELRQRFCKLLNISGFVVEETVRELKVNQNAHRALEQSASRINALAKEIRDSHCDQGQKADLTQKIKKIYDQVASKVATATRKPLLPLFQKRLFARMESAAEKQFVAELTGKKEEELKPKIGKPKAAEQRVKAAKEQIKGIVTMALQESQALKGKTLEFRAKLLKELRLSHGMSQSHLIALYKDKFPLYSMSARPYSWLENNNNLKVEGALIGHFSELLEVNEKLFYPGHWAEEETP